MTAPASQSDLQALLEEHADLILAIELTAATAAAAGLVQQLGQIQRRIAAQWVALVSTLTGLPTPEQAQRITRDLVDALQGVSVDITEPIKMFAQRAAETAQRQATTEVGARPSPVRAQVSPGLQQVIEQADAAARERLDAAVNRLQDTPPENWEQVTDALAVANQSRGSAEKAAAWAVNAAAAETVMEEAKRLDARILWVAERDACVACLAYSGLVAAVGGSFPIGRTYGDKPIRPWPDPQHLPGPPLHPHCRCRLMPWLGHDTQAAAAALPQGARTAHVDFPAALRREADRSILRGFSLPSESERSRLRAAERLLKKGVRAPESVKRYARGAIRRGGWPTRRVPTP